MTMAHDLFRDHKLEIARVAHHLAAMGWCEGNAGNISMLLPRGEYTPEDNLQASMPLPEQLRPLAGRTILITTSGSRFRRMMLDRESAIVPVTVSRFGNSILWPQEFKRPSSEISTHLQVLALAEARGWPAASIVHTHSTSMLALSSSDLPGETLEDAMWRAHPELSQLLDRGLHFLDFQTPGTWELGRSTAELFAHSGGFDMVICLGAVIRGETPHFEYVAAESAKGVAQAGMDAKIPVAYGIVTADTVEQAVDRAGAKGGNRGFDAALTALEMVNLYRQVYGFSDLDETGEDAMEEPAGR